jgi:hypothetical protein
MDPVEEEKAKKHLQKEVDMQLYEPARSPYSQLITWAPKHDDSIRMCINYVPINKISEKDRYPLPHMDSLRSSVRGAKFITGLDCKAGFQNLFIHPEDWPKLAFSVPWGQYQPIRLPYGWCNGPSIFQREFARTIPFGKNFIDDFFVWENSNMRRHNLMLCTTLVNAAERGFAFHAEKAQVLMKEATMVGLKASGAGCRPSYTDGVFDSLKRRMHLKLSEIQSTVGTLQWFRRFVPNFSYVIKPLLCAMQDAAQRQSANIDRDLREECLNAVQHVHNAVKAMPLLNHPDPTLGKTLYIIAGKYAFACSMYQEGPPEQILEFWSRIWPYSMKGYSETDRLALVLRECLLPFAPILPCLPSLLIYTASELFTALARAPDCWTPRMRRFMALTVQYPIQYHQSPLGTRSYLDVLDQPIGQDSLPEAPSPVIETLARKASQTFQQKNVPKYL